MGLLVLFAVSVFWSVAALACVPEERMIFFSHKKQWRHKIGSVNPIYLTFRVLVVDRQYWDPRNFIYIYIYKFNIYI